GVWGGEGGRGGSWGRGRRTAERVELGRRAAGQLRGEPKPHALDEAGGLTVDRPAINIDVVTVRTPHLLHDQRRPRRQLAGGIDMPNVNAGWPLMLGRDNGQRRGFSILRSIQELSRTP